MSSGTRSESAAGEGLSALVPGLSALWAETRGDPRVSIALLDGPVDLTHPCFAGADLEEVPTLVPAAASGGPASRHGTFVASVLFGAQGSPVEGIAPRCKGLVVPIFGEGAGGDLVPSSQTDLARAITQAADAGARVVNLSGGEMVDSAGMAGPLADAMELCAAEDVLVVAAAGNEGCRCIHVPAADSSALVVGAMDGAGVPSAFSNFGDDYREHGILAPGEDIPGAVPGGGTVRRSGTSHAVPIVSGVVALLLCRELRRGRRIRAREVRDLLLESATTCAMQPVPDCDRLFRGRLNIPGAIELLDARVNKIMVDQSTAVETGRTDRSETVAPAEPATTPAGLPAPAAPAGVAPAEAAPPEAAPPAPAPVAAEVTGGVAPADCGCKGKGKGKGGEGSLVFAIGSLGFDFGTEENRDAFFRNNGGPITTGAALQSYLATTANSDAVSVVWTLSIDSYPVYAIRPSGPFGDEAYHRLTTFVAEPMAPLVGIPGWRTGGTARLVSGEEVPVIEPDVGGISNWSVEALFDAVWAEVGPSPQASRALVRRALGNFFQRVYYEKRNAGASPEERALNFSATNANAACRIFLRTTAAGLELSDIGLEKSPLCRPESDCWDVKLVFFDPWSGPRRARQVFRYTVDVSDVAPVQIGDIRTWEIQ